MKERKVLIISFEEIRQTFEDKYNKDHNSNHLFKISEVSQASEEVKMEMTMFNKDEVTH